MSTRYETEFYSRDIPSIRESLKRIADALEKANELSKEKQKADINGMLTKSETEWLLAQQGKKKQQ